MFQYPQKNPFCLLSFKFRSSDRKPSVSSDIGGKLVQGTSKFGIFTVEFSNLVTKISRYSGNF